MNSELKKLQGTWKIEELEVDGQTMPGGASATISVKGSRFTTSSMGAVYEGTLELNETLAPKTFDLVFTTGPEVGNRSLGIYELNEDQWRICLTLTGTVRPKQFATTPGSGLALETLRRAGKSAKPAPEPEVQFDDSLAPSADLSGEWAMIACVFQGHPLEPGLIKMGRRIARENETTTRFGSNIFMKAKYSLDHNQNPRTIDYVLTEGTGKGKSQYGIWELTANTLKVCFTAPGQDRRDRPTDFTADDGSGRTLTIWKLIGK